jgi:hypothetical protein
MYEQFRSSFGRDAEFMKEGGVDSEVSIQGFSELLGEFGGHPFGEDFTEFSVQA